MLDDLYDECVRLTDAAVGRLFARLKEMELYDQALIIVTADHGESLQDHGEYGHRNVYDENARVPLLIKFPDGAFAGQRFASQVSLADIYPTVAEALETVPPEGLDGVSLLQVLREEAQPHEFTYIERGGNRAVRSNAWKYIHNRFLGDDARELYALEKDPAETENLLTDQPAQSELLHEEVTGHYEHILPGWHLYMMTPKQGWSGTLTITSSEPLAGYYQVYGDRPQLMPLEDPKRIQFMKEGIWPRIVVKPASQEGALTVVLESEQPFTVQQGDQSPERLTRFEAVLQRNVGEQPKPDLAQLTEEPSFGLWYEGPAGEAAPAPTEDQLEQLRALGYLE
jgi:hypothetical protein